MSQQWSKKVLCHTPWVDFMEIHTENAEGKSELYYGIQQPDYITVVPETPSGKIVMVRQYRPVINQVTLELPAGTIEGSESGEESCHRELLEETGHSALSLRFLGKFLPDSGRTIHHQHVYYARINELPTQPPTENNISVEYYSRKELKELISNGKFSHQLHISAFLLIDLFGI